jgi:hypothetical protein
LTNTYTPRHLKYIQKYRHSPKGKATVKRYEHAIYIRDKEEVKRLLGTKCVVCNNDFRMIHYHEIHGRKHTMHYSYILHHLKDFVPLCCRCHNVAHYLLNLGVNREKLLTLVNQMINEHDEKRQTFISHADI